MRKFIARKANRRVIARTVEKDSSRVRFIVEELTPRSEEATSNKGCNILINLD